MKTLLLFPLAALAACSPSAGFNERQQHAITSMSYTGQLMPYSCGYRAHAPHGYSKDSGYRHEATHVPGDRAPATFQQKMPRAVYAPYVVSGEGVPVTPAQTPAQTPAGNRQAELEAKVAALEKALVSNVGTMNQNQQMIVHEIAALKAQRTAAPERNAPTVANGKPTGIHFGND